MNTPVFTFDCRRGFWDFPADPLVIALGVVEDDILADHMAQRRLADDPQPISAFSFQGREPSLDVGIRIGRFDWRQDAFDTSVRQNGSEGGAELAVSVTDEMRNAIGSQPTRVGHGQVARDLGHHNLVWILVQAGDMDSARGQVHEHQDVDPAPSVIDSFA